MIMTQQNNLGTQPIQPSLGKRILAGAGIGLLLISIFLLPINKPNPEWGKLWMIRPLIIVPFAGAMGAVCNYFLIYFYKQARINKTVAIILSAIIFVIGMWIGFVLGLDGTLWD